LACPLDFGAGTSDALPSLFVGSCRSWFGAFASAPDPLAAISLGRADLRRVTGIAANFSDDPPLVRFGSLQRFPAALCGSRLPASNYPASAFSRLTHPHSPVSLPCPCGFFATRYLAPCEPLDIAARAGHSPDDLFIPVFRARHRPIATWSEELAFLPASLLGFDPFAVFLRFDECEGFWLSRTHLPFLPLTTRGLLRSILCPANLLSRRRASLGLVGLGFWALAP